MEEVDISDLKTRYLEIFDRVRMTKVAILVVRDGMPVAEIVPVSAAIERTRLMDCMKGKMEIIGEIISPASDEDEWECLRD